MDSILVQTISSDVELDDDDDEIQVIGTASSSRPIQNRLNIGRSMEGSRRNLLSTLRQEPTDNGYNSGDYNQRRLFEHEERRRRQIREEERQRLRRIRRMALSNRTSSENIEITDIDLSPSTVVHIDITDLDENDSVNTVNNGAGETTPIVIESDVEDYDDLGSVNNDAGAVSDSATIGSMETTSTVRQRMALSADERSINRARELQAGHLRALTNQRLYGSNEPIILDDEIDVVDDVDGNVDVEDDIQFITEREAPDVQVLSSNNTGYELFTPVGPVFVQSSEIRTGGGRRQNLFDSVSPNRSRVLRSYIRPDNTSNRQDELRRIQAAANRRAREAASSPDFINLSRNYRTRVSNAANDASISERTHNRPRRAASRALAGMIAERYPGLGIFDGTAAGMDEMHMFIRDQVTRMDFSQMANSDIMSDTDEIPSHIMNVLRNRDEERETRRVAERTKIAEREKAKKERASMIDVSLKGKFSNELMNKDEENVCVLCGVGLNVGLPDSCIEKNWHETSNAKELTEELLSEQFVAPWSGYERFTELEVEASKKMFFTSCGHIYCGRCVHNIQRFRSMTLPERRTELKKFKEKTKNISRVSATTIDFADPQFSAPLRCIAEGCAKKFTGQKPFTEMFL